MGSGGGCEGFGQANPGKARTASIRGDLDYKSDDLLQGIAGDAYF